MSGDSPIRLVVYLLADPERLSPIGLRYHAREAWCEGVARAAMDGHIEFAVAEELIRAWPQIPCGVILET